MKKRILFITTGGTIASCRQKDGSYGGAELKGAELLKSVESALNFDIDTIDLEPKISHNLTIEDKFELTVLIKSKAQVYDGIILTHGTNTLPETAFFLDLALPQICPVVLTAAMYPFGASFYDGWEHLNQSLRVLTNWSDRANVVVVFDHKVHAPCAIYKGLNDKEQLVLKSPAEYLMATIDQNIQWTQFKIPEYAKYRGEFSQVTQLPAVPIYRDDWNNEMLEWVLNSKPIAMVIAGAGEGFINEERMRLISKADIPLVMRASQIPGTMCQPTKYDQKYSTIPAGVLSPSKAQILLSFLVSAQIKLSTKSSLIF